MNEKSLREIQAEKVASVKTQQNKPSSSWRITQPPLVEKIGHMGLAIPGKK